jgi:hypothetical protein
MHLREAAGLSPKSLQAATLGLAGSSGWIRDKVGLHAHECNGGRVCAVLGEEKVMGSPVNPRATTRSPVFFLPQWSADFDMVTGVFLTGDFTRRDPPSTFTENGTDPILFTPARNAADCMGLP